MYMAVFTKEEIKELIGCNSDNFEFIIKFVKPRICDKLRVGGNHVKVNKFNESETVEVLIDEFQKSSLPVKARKLGFKEV